MYANWVCSKSLDAKSRQHSAYVKNTSIVCHLVSCTNSTRPIDKMPLQKLSSRAEMLKNIGYTWNFKAIFGGLETCHCHDCWFYNKDSTKTNSNHTDIGCRLKLIKKYILKI